MNKTTKGSLAAGAAAVLLLGGAGSLAFWTDAATVNGGAINSGFLTLKTVPVSATQDCTPFKYAETFKNAGATVTNFVPGDVVSTVCTFVIGAQGDNLAAAPTVPATLPMPSVAPKSGASTTGASFSASVAVAYQLGLPGALAPYSYTGTNPITQADNAKQLVATITVKIPFGTADKNADGSANAGVVNGNQTQNIVATLDKLNVSLTQVTPNTTNP